MTHIALDQRSFSSSVHCAVLMKSILQVIDDLTIAS